MDEWLDEWMYQVEMWSLATLKATVKHLLWQFTNQLAVLDVLFLSAFRGKYTKYQTLIASEATSPLGRLLFQLNNLNCSG